MSALPSSLIGAPPVIGDPSLPGGYLDAVTITGLVFGLIVAAICTLAGLHGRPPGRVTVGATWALQVVVTVINGIYLWRVLDGQSPVGPSWELWSYLVTILLLPVLAVIWARQEPSRWSTFVLAVAAFIGAVMIARCGQIWYGLGFG